MKRIYFLLVLTLTVIASNAQNRTTNSMTYKTAIGARIWDGAGLSLKTFFADKQAMEFIGFFNGNGTRITGLYELHGDLSTESNLKWYVGPGAHIGLYKIGGNPKTYGGIDGVIGVDYKFSNMPLNISLDWQPSIEFGSGTEFQSGWGGLGIRFTI